ncbi:MAG TPA: FAD-dependent oxidoreductase, partial [Dongiaceae bacterium]
MVKTLHIIGGGLAGSEAAWQAANRGVPVVLHEMRPGQRTEAHKTDSCAELVCSNSFRSDDWENNAVGLLHEEMRRAGSLILRAADAHQTDSLAELVCSNSFRSDDARNNAVGLLHEEMRRAGSLVMGCADSH